MPLAGKGMLLTSMDIDPADEADFNRWYDREHLQERVAIEGFIEARRYVAEQGSPKYLCLYSTESIDVLDSASYRARLADRIDLMHQAKQAHWNVKGPSCIALHKLFDEVVDAAEDSMDLLAERVVQLGGTAEGTL